MILSGHENLPRGEATNKIEPYPEQVELEYLRAEFEANKDKVYTKAEFDKLQKAFQEQAKIKDEYFLEIERLKAELLTLKQ